MDHPEHQQQSASGTHIVYSSPSMAALSSPMPHQHNQGGTHIVYSSPSMAYTQPMPHQQSSPMPHQQVTYAQPALHTPQQQEQLRAFWANQMQEIEQTTDFRNHTLPLARIKKIMKADEDVRMISAEAPVVFAKACEIFILELTLRSWIHTEENKRRTLQKNDIAAAITRTDVFDFLVDIIPRDELKEEGLGVIKAGIPMVGSPGDGLPYYYLPPPQHASGMMMGNPVEPGRVYLGQQARMLPFIPWPHDAGQGGSRQQGSSDS